MNTDYKKQSTVNNVTNSKNETITIDLMSYLRRIKSQDQINRVDGRCCVRPLCAEPITWYKQYDSTAPSRLSKASRSSETLCDNHFFAHMEARSIRRNAQIVQKVLDASPDAIISVTRLNNIVTVTADRDTIVKLRCALPVETVESCSALCLSFCVDSVPK